jgi:subtilisin family serine protease
MERNSGSPGVTIGVIDGPVVLDHPDLMGRRIQETTANSSAACLSRTSSACAHGTFVLGMLAATRNSAIPGICPDCTFLLSPIFSERTNQNAPAPSATSSALAEAIVNCVRAGTRVLNLSVGLTGSSFTHGERQLEDALTFAAQRGVIAVVAAGNQGVIGSSPLTGHPWALPVVACDEAGRPLQRSNLAASIGKRGLSALGEGITSLGPDGTLLTISGTSAATPLVTGAIALLWSEFPAATAAEIKLALMRRTAGRRPSIVPPMLDAWEAYQSLKGRSEMAAD